MQSDAVRLTGNAPGASNATKLLGHCQPGLQPIFVKSCTKISAAIPDIALSLKLPQSLLRLCRGRIQQWVMIYEPLEKCALRRFMRWVERDEQEMGWIGCL